MPLFYRFCGALAASATALLVIAVSARGQSIVINSGAQAWVDAAHTSRADMLVLGDSVVWTGGHGWDAGLINAFNNRIGLAGTGLIPDSSVGGQGEGYAAYGNWISGFTADPGAVPASQRGFVWHDVAITAGATPATGFGFGVSGSTLDPSAAYDWHLWTASPPGGGSLGARRRLGASPYTVIQTIPPVALNSTAGEPNKTVFHFTQSAIPSATSQEFQLDAATNTSLLYSRLLKPGATGVTVSSWGYGGRSTLDFYNDRWLGSLMDSSGRQALLDNLVDSGSGKLNVLIAEGFNDRGETSPSVHGITPGNSAAAFRDNMESLVAAIRADWTAGGNAPADLSFTLLGQYEDTWGGPPRDFADALRQMALADPQIAFIDLYELAPSYAALSAGGYMADGTHPSYSGSLMLSDTIVTALLPEPSGIALPTALAALILNRRRCTMISAAKAIALPHSPSDRTLP